MRSLNIVSYYFSGNSVGTQRAKFLFSYLREHGYEINVVTENTFGVISEKSKLAWSLGLFLYLIRSKTKLIFVTSGPFWYLPIVWLVSLFNKADVIYDFRDPWSFDMEKGYGGTLKKGSFLKLKITRILERFFYRQCKYFFVCSEGMYTSYKKLFNDDSKLKLVLNGYEYTSNDILCDDKSLKESESIKLVFLGKFLVYGKSKANAIFANIEKNINTTNVDVKLVFVGSDRMELEQELMKYNLLSNAVFYERMPHINALHIASCCDIGICLIRDEELMYGTKIYDYIGLGIPVLDVFDHEENFFSFFKEYTINIDSMAKPFRYEPPENLSRKYIFENAIPYFL